MSTDLDSRDRHKVLHAVLFYYPEILSYYKISESIDKDTIKLWLISSFLPYLWTDTGIRRFIDCTLKTGWLHEAVELAKNRLIYYGIPKALPKEELLHSYCLISARFPVVYWGLGGSESVRQVDYSARTPFYGWLSIRVDQRPSYIQKLNYFLNTYHTEEEWSWLQALLWERPLLISRSVLHVQSPEEKLLQAILGESPSSDGEQSKQAFLETNEEAYYDLSEPDQLITPAVYVDLMKANNADVKHNTLFALDQFAQLYALPRAAATYRSPIEENEFSIQFDDLFDEIDTEQDERSQPDIDSDRLMHNSQNNARRYVCMQYKRIIWLHTEEWSMDYALDRYREASLKGLIWPTLDYDDLTDDIGYEANLLFDRFFTLEFIKKLLVCHYKTEVNVILNKAQRLFGHIPEYTWLIAQVESYRASGKRRKFNLNHKSIIENLYRQNLIGKKEYEDRILALN